MSIANIHLLQGIKIGGALIGQISNASANTAMQMLLMRQAGVVNRTLTAMHSQNPIITFDSSLLSTVIDEFGESGNDESAGNVDLQFQKVVEYGTRVAVASAGHEFFRVAASMGVMDRLSVSQGSLAQASCRLAIAYDGSNEPIVPTTGAINGTYEGEQPYSLGAVQVNGVTLTGVTGWEVDFGIELIQASADGDPWNTFLAVRSISPVVTIDGIDASWMRTYGLDGTALDGVNGVKLFARKKQQDGTNATGSGSAVSVLALNGLLTVSQITGDDDSSASQLVIYPRALTEIATYFTMSSAATHP